MHPAPMYEHVGDNLPDSEIGGVKIENTKIT